MSVARIVADRDAVLSALDRRLFGAFVEHLGRCVYGGIFEPGHPSANENGFRGDVLALTRELGPTIVRYPGGNFLSGYDWEDGVGPREARPRRLDLAWFSTETNQFGTNEFMEWCRAVGAEPMLGVNLGTRGADAARALLEYCNHPAGTDRSDRRRAHGFPQPHGVKTWCLGNEMDGPWQIGHKTAEEYGRIAVETAKVMRWVDDSISLVACGSSYRAMPTFGDWERVVLKHCYEHVDLISLHTYFVNPAGRIEDAFANIERMDGYIRDVIAICDGVGEQLGSPKRIMLAFDEWNAWSRTRGPEHMRQPGWPEAPHHIEEVYDVADALIVGGALVTLLNNADRVKVACLAQLVNAIGAIMTEPGGPAWRQTIFHPFALASRFAHGNVLAIHVETPAYASELVEAITHLHAAMVDDPARRHSALLALNRSAAPLDVTVELRGFPQGLRVAEALTLHDDDLAATNTRDAPERVRPAPLADVRMSGTGLSATLPPYSFTVIALRG